jgi:type I restriction enzyme S subunit
MSVSTFALGDLVWAHYGKALKEEDRESTGSVVVYGSSGEVGRHRDALTQEPTIVVGRKGSVGAITFAPNGGWIIDTAYFLERKNPRQIDLRYLFHALRSADLAKDTITTSIPGLNRDALLANVIRVPKIDDQRNIAAILDKADSLRRKRRETIRLANELLVSKFEEAFGNPHTNAKSLPTISLGELVKLKSGNFLPSHEMAGTGGVLVYGGNGVNGVHDVAMFEEVKLVIGRVGAYCGAVHLTKPRSWITDNALYVSEISPMVRIEYLAFALTQAKLNQYSSQSGQPLVSASRLYPVMLVLPPLELQDTFLEVLNRTKCVQKSQEKSLEAIEEMSRSLAAELFTQR